MLPRRGGGVPRQRDGETGQRPAARRLVGGEGGRLRPDGAPLPAHPEVDRTAWGVQERSANSPYNFAGITYDRLRKLPGLQWPCPTEDSPGTVRRYVEGDDPLVTPGAKVEFYGQPDRRAVVFLRPYQPAPEVPSTEFPFLLTTGRVLEQWHTGTMTDRIPELHRASGRGHFEINDQDAFTLGVRTGDSVRVRSRFGSLTGKAVVTPAQRFFRV